MSVNVPDALKRLKPFLQRAHEVEDRYKLVAYYCRLYVLEEAIADPIRKTDKEVQMFLLHLMDDVEKLKPEMPSKAEAQPRVESFALSVFKKAASEDLNGRATRATVATYRSAVHFLEVCQVFSDDKSGPKPHLKQELAEKLKYAKWKAIDIHKALAAGEVPTPGGPGFEPPKPEPLEGEEEEGEGEEGGEGSGHEEEEEGLGMPPPPPYSNFAGGEEGEEEKNGGESLGPPPSTDELLASLGIDMEDGKEEKEEGGAEFPPPPSHPSDPPPPAYPSHPTPAAASKPQPKPAAPQPARSQPAVSGGGVRSAGGKVDGESYRIRSNVPYDSVSKAKKFIKFAQSALDFKDYKTVVKQLQDAINEFVE